MSDQGDALYDYAILQAALRMSVMAFCFVQMAIGLPPAYGAPFIRSSRLRVELRTATHQYVVRDGRTGRTWITAPLPGLPVTHATALSRDRMAVLFRDKPTGRLYTCEVRVWNGANVSFALSCHDLASPLGRLDFPGALRLADDPSELSLIFCNRACGQMVPQKEDYPNKGFWCYGNLGLDMPWMGVVDVERGDGYMLLLETPYDAAVFLQADELGRHWPQTAWHGEFDRFAYPRKVSLRFTTSGGYVAQAKVYRAYAQRTGGFRSLADKARERPNVNLLRGAPILWGASMIPSALKFAEEAHAAGIRRAVIKANGKFPPEDIERMKSLGYLVGEYDNVTDIFDGPPGFTTDSVERYAALDRDGRPYKGWQHTDGRQMYRRATWRAVEFFRGFLDEVLAQYPFSARFLDVASTIDPLEDWRQGHRQSRRQELAARRRLYAEMARRGLVVGGEHCKSWIADLLDYAEGVMSGPFWWEMPVGHLKSPTSRSELSPNYLKYGMGPAYRIPLWELVYHDAVVTTWYWGDTSGYAYEVAPELSDQKDLWNILYGTPPMFWLNETGYGWYRHRDRLLLSYRRTCGLHERIAFCEMRSHAFLTRDRLVQQTRFSDGTVCTVNFGAKPCTLSLDGHRITLAPLGYYVAGPGYQQWRLMEEGRVREHLPLGSGPAAGGLQAAD